MFFNDWSKQISSALGETGHGSRRKIAEAVGVTSETIRAAEVRGEASDRMVRGLEAVLRDRGMTPYPPVKMTEAGRWNVGRARDGGVLITHLVPSLACTVHVMPDGAVRATAYREIGIEQMASIVEEAVGLAKEEDKRGSSGKEMEGSR